MPGSGGPVHEHLDCFLRTLFGSVAHLEGRCSYYVSGSQEGDPPEMSRREAARRARRGAVRTAKGRVRQNVFDRWIIDHPRDSRLAWSGSCWVPITEAGLPIAGRPGESDRPVDHKPLG